MEYKIVVIDNFWSTNEKEAAAKMGEILNIKKQAYANEQSSNYLPVGTDDYYCIHVAVCEKQSGDTIFTFKVVPRSYSNNFSNAKFPVDYFADSTCTEIDKMRLKKLMKKMDEKHEDWCYSGGWAMGKQFRGLGLSKEFRDVYTGIHYNLHKTYNLGAMFAIGLIDSGTYDFFEKAWNAPKVMDTKYTLDGFNGCECHFIFQETNSFAEGKKSLGQKYQGLWEDREVYGQQEKSIKKVAA